VTARILSSATIMEDLTADFLGEWESEGGATIRLDVGHRQIGIQIGWMGLTRAVSSEGLYADGDRQ